MYKGWGQTGSILNATTDNAVAVQGSSKTMQGGSFGSVRNAGVLAQSTDGPGLNATSANDFGMTIQSVNGVGAMISTINGSVIVQFGSGGGPTVVAYINGDGSINPGTCTFANIGAAMPAGSMKFVTDANTGSPAVGGGPGKWVISTGTQWNTI
jgi:hypothetical protein